MKQTLLTLKAKRQNREKVTMVTAYDYTMARLVSSAGPDMILVGDSLGMVMLGYSDTLSVTMDDMVHHTRAVSRGAGEAFLVADMPFLSYEVDVRDAVYNAGRLMKEGRAQAVKLEGGREVCPAIRAMVESGIPVVGHVGMTPQSVNVFGGFKVQGKDMAAAQKIVDDARAVAEAGAFCIVIECVPSGVARFITEQVDCLTIGIGAGPDCGGQVLVAHDLLGMNEEFLPKFVQRFATLGSSIREGVQAYCSAVREGRFPDKEHSFHADAEVLRKLH